MEERYVYDQADRQFGQQSGRQSGRQLKHQAGRQSDQQSVHRLDRRQFLFTTAGLFVLGASGALAGCAGGTSSSGSASGASSASGSSANSALNTEPITMVFLPDNSSADLTPSREAIGEYIRQATGREAKLMTTTDYNVAIEAVASGSGAIALLGAEGYVQANNKNASVQAAFTTSDEEGKLDGACYYSRICVRSEDAEQYRDGSSFTLTPLQGKSFSFVSATSTSGFKVPAAKLVEEFDLPSNEVLLQNGGFFSAVLLGGSHQGSVVNLMSGDADAAAFDDIDVDMYLTLVSGEANMPGAVYKVRDDAEEPFESVRGKQFTILSSTAVLNAPFCFNEDVLNAQERDAIVKLFCSSTVAADERIFSDPDDENAKALYVKKSEQLCFLPVDDAWYDPIRKLS